MGVCFAFKRENEGDRIDMTTAAPDETELTEETDTPSEEEQSLADVISERLRADMPLYHKIAGELEGLTEEVGDAYSGTCRYQASDFIAKAGPRLVRFAKLIEPLLTPA